MTTNGLTPEQERWARRLAEVQAERNELVRLLGLIGLLSNLSSRHGQDGAAQEITELLLNYLQADCCYLYLVETSGEPRMAAASGVAPAPPLLRQLEAQVHKGLHNVTRLDDALGSYYLVCLPVRSGQELLGVMGVIQRQEPTQNRLRHLNLALQAMIPLLENHLVRLRLEQVCQGLTEQARDSHARLNDLQAVSNLQEASLEALLSLNLEPLFLLDESQRLMRHNQALPRLLGLEGQSLEGRFLGDILVGGEGEGLGQGSQPQPVELAAQCGGRVIAFMHLVPVRMEGRDGLVLGRLSPGPRLEDDMVGRLAGELGQLGQLAGEVINQANNQLMIMRSQIELLLMNELPEALRKRLELLENLALDSGGAVRHLREVAENLDRFGRDLAARLSLWQARD